MDGIVHANNSSGTAITELITKFGTLALALNHVVLFGLGGKIYNSPGNVIYRLQIETRVNDYLNATRLDDKIRIVDECHQAIDQIGLIFLKKNTDGKWDLATFPQARNKVSHCVRDTAKRREEALRREHNQELNQLAEDEFWRDDDMPEFDNDDFLDLLMDFEDESLDPSLDLDAEVGSIAFLGEYDLEMFMDM